jgi:hypothetical protein
MARQHHYLFAYMALPDFAYRDVARFLAFSPPFGKAFVTAIWDLAGQGLAETMPADGLEFGVEQLPSGLPVAVVQFPAPVEPPEAYFAAITRDPNGATRYFTLERSLSLDESDAVQTILGGVEFPDGNFRHINFGEGPAPDRQAFLQSVNRLLNPPSA